MVHYIPSGEYAFYAGRGGVPIRAAVDPDITVFHIQLIGKYIGIGFMTDSNEYPG